MTDVSAVILAGGRSSRFGSDKAAALLHGLPMLQHVIDAVTPVADEIVIVAAPGRPLPPVVVGAPSLVVVEDREEGHGPLAGLSVAFESATGEAAIAVSTDAPLLVPGLLQALVTALGEHHAVLPVVDGYRQPLVAAYDRKTCGPAFAMAFEAGKRRILAALDGLDVLEVDAEWVSQHDPALVSFRNANTPDALAELEKLSQPPS